MVMGLSVGVVALAGGVCQPSGQHLLVGPPLKAIWLWLLVPGAFDATSNCTCGTLKRSQIHRDENPTVIPAKRNIL